MIGSSWKFFYQRRIFGQGSPHYISEIIRTPDSGLDSPWRSRGDLRSPTTVVRSAMAYIPICSWCGWESVTASINSRTALTITTSVWWWRFRWRQLLKILFIFLACHLHLMMSCSRYRPSDEWCCSISRTVHQQLSIGTEHLRHWRPMISVNVLHYITFTIFQGGLSK